MFKKFVFFGSALGAIFMAGCATPLPPGAEPGPNGTMAYDVLIESSPPGARIEANGEPIGNAPLHLKIFGDRDGTFHDFGSASYEVRAMPVGTNQFVQTRWFGTGQMFGPEDKIPHRIYFDMSQPQPTYAPGYAYPPRVYYGPPVYYGDPFYYGPSFRFYVGPRYYHHHHRH